MKTLAALLCAAGLLLAQHQPDARQKEIEHKTEGQAHARAEHEGRGHEDAEHKNLDPWKWANFAVLAALLGWMIGKNAGPFFAARTAEIRKGIADADRVRAEAEARVREVDARLAGLQSEIDALRSQAAVEQDAQARRMREETEAELEKNRLHGQREIEAAGKAARMELKRYVASLAIALAERQIRQNMDPPAQDSLVADFTRNLAPPAEAARR